MVKVAGASASFFQMGPLGITGGSTMVKAHGISYRPESQPDSAIRAPRVTSNLRGILEK